MVRPIGSQNEAFCQTRWTKYRSDPGRFRGHFNDFLAVWMGTFRNASLLELGRVGLVRDAGLKGWRQVHGTNKQGDLK